MGIIQKNEFIGSVSAQASHALARLHKVPRGKKLTFWSAAVLAFLIAPIAALSLSAKPGTAVNSEAGSANTANAAPAETTLPSSQEGLGSDSLQTGSVQNASSANVQSTITSSVSVNGQEVEVPENGNVNKTVVNQNGQTTHINISSSNSSSGSDDSHTVRNNLRVHTNTSSNVRQSQ